MAYLKSKTLFFTTSPRTPLKMIPEIQVLYNNFDGEKWNTNTQVEFIKKLAEGSDFAGKGSEKIWLLVQETELIEHRNH